MKKIIAIGLAGLLLAVSPWWLGKVAQRRVDKGFESLPRYAPYLKVVENTWTHSWFSSEHLTTFEVVLPGRNANLEVAAAGDGVEPAAPEAPAVQQIPNASTPPKPFRFSVRDKVRHGPILGSAGVGVAVLDSKLVLGEEVSRKLAEVLGTDDPVQVVTRMGFFGSTEVKVSGTARSIDLAKLDAKLQGGSIAWDDFHLTMDLGRGLRSYRMDGKQPRIEFRDQKGSHVLFTDMTLEGHGKRITESLYDGAASAGIGKLVVEAADKTSMQIDRIAYEFEADRQGDFLDYGMEMGSGEVRSRELEPIGITLAETHFDFTMRHLHLETLEKLMLGLREANVQVFEGKADAESAALAPFMEHGMALMKHDPELAIDRIGIVTPQGDALIKGTLKLPRVTGQDLSAGALVLLQKLVADITIEVAQALLDKVPNGGLVSGAGVDAGYFRREGDKLVSHIEYRDGTLLVNGKPPRMPENIQIPGLTPPAPPPAQ
jgi:uncharacterized protein YdgA (DUF945 family)